MQTSTIDPVPFFNKVLLATDFSEASQAAFKTALGVHRVSSKSLSLSCTFFSTSMPSLQKREGNRLRPLVCECSATGISSKEM